MNTRQKILALLNEGKTIDEVEELLKDEKVSNLRVYIHRVNRDIRLNKIKQKGIDRINEASGFTETKIGECYRENDGKWYINLKCIICGKTSFIHINDGAQELWNNLDKTKYKCLFCNPKKKR